MIQTLKEAVYALIVLSLCTAILSGFGGTRAKLAPYVKYLLSLILLLMLLSPLLDVISAVGALTEKMGGGITEKNAVQGMTIYEENTVAYAAAQTEDSVCTLIAAKTGIPRTSLSLALTLDTADVEAVVITSAALTVTGTEYRIIADKAVAITEETLLCPCTVTVVSGEEVSSQ
ncbi:MAG: hypothetical protein IJ449_08155 [Clostridia bacterium]|nr:hypothetical protein [Clostridia bacterium]